MWLKWRPDFTVACICHTSFQATSVSPCWL